ncbi:PREDICTED: guanylate cyclase 32E-like [Priapulus caudatus]|uniref:Guanylate cyclase 32E-like n=1 Tax=Priapulus caudatus TaxID=37621 RepID=A0ABM1E973_PRICU|nr:PREDICTED: guanylate cyclase 32E-like [Priapulus caudatus]
MHRVDTRKECCSLSTSHRCRLMVQLFVMALSLADLSHAEIFRLGYITGNYASPEHPMYTKPGQSISGALSLAVSEINSDRDILPNDILEFVVGETHGDSLLSLKQTARLWTDDVSAYIGPQETCFSEANLAAAFNIPMISHFCLEPEVSDKGRFPTFARTRPQASDAVTSVLKQFNWNSVYILHSANEYFTLVARSVQKHLHANHITVNGIKTWEAKYFHGFTANPFIPLIDESYAETRIYLVIGDTHEYIGLLTYMEERGLFDNGDYFVVGLHVDEIYKHKEAENYIKGVLEPFVQEATVRAYRSYIGIIGAPPVNPAYNKFTAAVNQYLEAPPFNFVNPLKLFGLKRQKIIRPEAAYLYDAVYLYARAVHAAKMRGEDPRDGRNLLKHIAGTSYQSVTGYLVHMDEHADAQGNFTLMALKMIDAEPTRYGLVPVGSYAQAAVSESDTTQRQEHRLDLFTSIDWVQGIPPTSEPLGGFPHTDCFNENLIDDSKRHL